MKSLRQQYFFRGSKATQSSISLLWLVPFLGFLIGYVVAGYFVQKKDVPTPDVVGKPLAQAIQTLSQERLGVRLLTQREEPTLPEATVLDQLPRPGQKMRPNQTVFVTISTKQPPLETPDWWGKRIKDIVPMLEKRGLQQNIIQLQSAYPQGMCIAQVPTAGRPLTVKTVTLFISLGTPSLAIMPLFDGLKVPDFERLLEQKDIRVEYVHQRSVGESHRCDECVIVGQQPVAGAMVAINKTIDLQILLRNQQATEQPIPELPAAQPGVEAVVLETPVADAESELLLDQATLDAMPQVVTETKSSHEQEPSIE